MLRSTRPLHAEPPGPCEDGAGRPASLDVAGTVLAQIAGTLTCTSQVSAYLDRVCAAVRNALDTCEAVETHLDADAMTPRHRWLPTQHSEAGRPSPPTADDASEGSRALSIPMVSAGRRFGVLTLRPGPDVAISDSDRSVAGLAASRAADAIAAVVDVDDARALAAQLETAMRTRAVIEQAKGIIMARLGVDADTAFDILRRDSQDCNRKVHALATEIVGAAVHRGGPRSGRERRSTRSA